MAKNKHTKVGCINIKDGCRADRAWQLFSDKGLSLAQVADALGCNQYEAYDDLSKIILEHYQQMAKRKDSEGTERLNMLATRLAGEIVIYSSNRMADLNLEVIGNLEKSIRQDHLKNLMELRHSIYKTYEKITQVIDCYLSVENMYKVISRDYFGKSELENCNPEGKTYMPITRHHIHEAIIENIENIRIMSADISEDLQSVNEILAEINACGSDVEKIQEDRYPGLTTSWEELKNSWAMVDGKMIENCTLFTAILERTNKQLETRKIKEKIIDFCDYWFLNFIDVLRNRAIVFLVVMLAFSLLCGGVAKHVISKTNVAPAGTSVETTETGDWIIEKTDTD